MAFRDANLYSHIEAGTAMGFTNPESTKNWLRKREVDHLCGKLNGIWWIEGRVLKQAILPRYSGDNTETID